MKRILIILSLFTLFLPKLEAQEQYSRVELFAGVDLNYRSIILNEKIFEKLIYITPAVKWHIPEGWLVSVQGAIPILNEYGKSYRFPKISVADLSKEFNSENHNLKISGGIFSHNRYGLDLKWEWVPSSIFAVESQIGFTGYCTLANKWQFSPMDRLTGTVTAKLYLEKSDTELKLTGGRFIYADYGAKAELLKHFSRVTTVGVFVQYGDHYGTTYYRDGIKRVSHYGGGAKIVIKLPYQGDSSKKFKFRPASNFRMTYDYHADSYGMKMYQTDPEENERDGNFSGSKWRHKR